MNRRDVLILLKVAITAALLGLAARLVDTTGLLNVVRRASTTGLLLASAPLLLQAVFIAWRWQRIVAATGHLLDFASAWRWVMVGLFFNQVLPASVGGDVVRVWWLKRRLSTLGPAFASVAIERITGMTVLALMVAACLPVRGAGLSETQRWPLALAGPLLLVGLLTLASADRWLSTAAGLAKWGRALATVAQALQQLGRQPGTLAAVVLFGAAANLCPVVCVQLLAWALGLQLDAPAALLLVGGTVLVTVLPVSLGGWGLREAAMVLLGRSVGLVAHEALVLSLGFGLLQLLAALPGGLLWWGHKQEAPPLATEAPLRQPL